MARTSGFLKPRYYALLGASCSPAVLALYDVIPGRLGAITPPAVFAATQLCIPEARPSLTPAVSPKNLILAGFGIQLVVAPALFMLVGPVEWVFPVAQTWASIQKASLLVALSFPCWALGLVAWNAIVPQRSHTRSWDSVPRWLIAGFVILGAAGVALYVMQVRDGTATTTGQPSADLLPRSSREAVAQVARLLLRPFLAAASVAIVSNLLLRQGGGALVWRRQIPALVACAAALILSYGTVDARRAPLLAAALGFLAAYALLTGRPSLRWIMTIGVVATVAFFAVRILRSPDASFALLFSGTGSSEGALHALDTEVQSYGGGLQTIAFLLDHVGLAQSLHGLGQIYTALSPIPGLGTPFRDSTPTAFYNSLFVNRTDQVLPLAGQLFMDFGAASVVVGFAFFGALSQSLERAFRRSRTLIEAFIWATPSAWLAFALGSGPTGFYQNAVYFSVPSVTLLVVMSVRRNRRPRQLVSSS